MSHDTAQYSYCKVASIRRGGPSVGATEITSILLSMTRTRSEARRRAARGPQDPDAQAGITTDDVDPPHGDPRVTHDEAVNEVLHSPMAAMLMALLTTRLLVAALVLGAVPLQLGAAHRRCGHPV